MKKSVFFLLLSSFCAGLYAQSFEVMPGVERIFVDVQYFKPFASESKFSLFTRTRSTAEYDEQATNLFAGAYFNYTTRSGFGGTALGRIASNGSGVDAGIHYFKASKKLVVFVLPSINLSDQLFYSWFSILRYTPKLSEKIRFYSSLELFSAFSNLGHLTSVQRIRLGIDKKGYQVGLAINLTESRFASEDVNPGLFIRKQF